MDAAGNQPLFGRCLSNPSPGGRRNRHEHDAHRANQRYVWPHSALPPIITAPPVISASNWRPETISTAA